MRTEHGEHLMIPYFSTGRDDAEVPLEALFPYNKCLLVTPVNASSVQPTLEASGTSYTANLRAYAENPSSLRSASRVTPVVVELPQRSPATELRAVALGMRR